MRPSSEELQHRHELTVLLEAAGLTVGRLARRAGFELKPAACGTGHAVPGGRKQAVLYEATPEDFDARFPERAVGEGWCVDLWVSWYPEIGQLEVTVDGFPGTIGLERVASPELVAAATHPATDAASVERALAAWTEAVAAWLGIGPGTDGPGRGVSAPRPPRGPAAPR